VADLELLDLEPFKARLDEVNDGLVRDLGFAADSAAATAPGAVLASPSAFIVLTGAEPFEIREGSGPLRQLFNVNVSVLVAVKFAGSRGQAALKAFAAPNARVRGALFGWRHPGAERGCWSGGESLEDFDGKTGVAVYRLDFVAQAKIQEQL
jgi:hypothetical protein